MDIYFIYATTIFALSYIAIISDKIHKTKVVIVGAVVHKTMDTVDASQITTFVNTSLRKAITQIKDENVEEIERC